MINWVDLHGLGLLRTLAQRLAGLIEVLKQAGLHLRAVMTQLLTMQQSHRPHCSII